MTTIGTDNVPERITAIMKKPTAGTVPSVSPPGWDWLQKKVGRLKGKWVRFHIVNRLLGGPGNRTWNLVPTSVAVNNAFSQNIEEDAKASAANRWTYLDVELEYDNNWPAPIPRKIKAEWGVWKSPQWKRKHYQEFNNPDITTLGDGSAYLRGTNITYAQLRKRGVPDRHLRAFADFLIDNRQATDADWAWLTAAESNPSFGADFDPSWLNQMWLDEDDSGKGEYQAVVKAL